MTARPRRCTLALFFAAALLSEAATASNKHVSFVTCPIFRDAARQCWLAEYGGELYYIGRFGMGPAPQLLHKVLVEGTIADEPRSCGGTVLEPIYISTLPEIDYSCNTVLPDNGDRPSELTLMDMPPERLSLIGQELPVPQPPYIDRKYVLDFEFNNTFLHQLMQREVETAAKYAIAGGASRITVTGYTASSKLDTGEMLTERDTIAEERARLVGEALIALGVKDRIVKVAWESKPIAGTGVRDAYNRKVIISVEAFRTKR